MLIYIFILIYTSALWSQNNKNRGMVQYKQTLVGDTILNILDETNGTLFFDTEMLHSLYVWDKKNRNFKREYKKKEDGSVQVVQPNGRSGTDTIGRRVYKEFNSAIIYVRERLGQWFIVTDSVVIKWDITDETKISCDMTLQKAICDFHGRHYTAWFNPQIPIPEGPWKFRGLPGLILEVYDEKKHVKFEFISMSIPTDFDEKISKPTGYSSINYSQYLESEIKTMNEAPKKIEAKLIQQGIKVSNATFRCNLLERSH